MNLSKLIEEFDTAEHILAPNISFKRVYAECVLLVHTYQMCEIRSNFAKVRRTDPDC